MNVDNRSEFSLKSHTKSLSKKTNLKSRFTGSQTLNFNDSESIAASISSIGPAKRRASLSNQNTLIKDPNFIGQLNPRFLKREDSEIFCIKISPDSEHIAVGLGDGTVQVYSTKTNNITFSLVSISTTSQVAKMPVTSICFRPNRKEFKHGNVLCASYSDGRLIHWHYETGQRLNVIQEDNSFNTIEYSPNGEIFVAAGSEPVVSVYDSLTFTKKFDLVTGRPNETAGHSNRIFSCKFHPKNNNILYTGGWDKTVQKWDLSKQISVKSLFGPYLCGDSLDVSQAGDKLLTCSYRQSESIQIWDIKTFELVNEIKWSEQKTPEKNSCLYSGEFSSDGKYVICGGGSNNHNEVRLFEVSSGKCVGMISGCSHAFFSATLSSNGRILAIGGGAKSLYVFDVDPNIPVDFSF